MTPAARLIARNAPNGGAVLGGHVRGDLDLGGGHVLAGSSVTEGFVALLDEEQAVVLAVPLAGQAGTEGRTVRDVSLGPTPSAVAVGSFDGSLLLEGLDPAASSGGVDGYVARLDEAGAFIWRTVLSGEDDQRPLAAVVLETTVVVAGGVRGVTDLGGQTLDAGTTERGFVALYALGSGELQGGGLTSLPGSTFIQDVAVTPDGRVLAGHGGDGGLVLINSDGTEGWARPFGTAVVTVAAQDGMMFAAGSFTGTLDLDEHVVDSAGGLDGYVARIEPETGEIRWLQSYGGLGAEAVVSIAVGCDGRLIMSLSTDSPLTLAGRDLASNGGLDIVIARLDPESGVAESAERFGGDGDQVAFSVVAQQGAPLLAGVFEGELDFGSGALSSGGTSLFAVRAPLAPAGE